MDVENITIELIQHLARIAPEIERRDRDLGSQLRRAATSISLNIAEGSRREGKDRIWHFRIAGGSAAETRMALRVAVAWGYVGTQPVADQLLDRIIAMCWRLVHPPKK
jgi:four helix bundle protein